MVQKVFVMETIIIYMIFLDSNLLNSTNGCVWMAGWRDDSFISHTAHIANAVM